MKIYFVPTGSAFDEELLAALRWTGFEVVEAKDPPKVHGRRETAVAFAAIDPAPDPDGSARVAYLVGAGVETRIVCRGPLPDGLDWIRKRARICASTLEAVVTFMSQRLAEAQAAGRLPEREGPLA